MSFNIKEAGPAPLISVLCDHIGLTETFNQCVEWDKNQCLLPPGIHVKAIVINILCGRSPLYRLPEFYAEQDLDLLFGLPCRADNFNDDVLCRTLDKMSDAGAKKVFSAIVAKALAVENVDISVGHGDTTSKVVFGQYNGDGDLNVTYGYSKDHRPDLKQILYGLLTTKDGVPFLAEIRDGNLDDKTWNKQLVSSLKDQLSVEELQKFTYVADSAAVTKDSLHQFAEAGVKVISRLPNTYGLASELIEQAWKDNDWQDAGALAPGKNKASYRLKEYSHDLFGRDYRFIVVHSSQLDKRKQAGLEKKLAKELAELEKAVVKQEKLEYACEADALGALVRFTDTHSGPFYAVIGEVHESSEREKRKKPGRPSKGETAELRQIYSLKLKIEEQNREAVKHEQERLSCFVLVTSVSSEEANALSILQEYKDQSMVENRFKFIKSPLFVGALYTQRKDRLEALSYLVMVAMLIYSLLERRVRRALELDGKPLILQGNIQTMRPTGNKILELLGPVKILLIQDGEKMTRHLPENYDRHARLLELAGFSLEIYRGRKK